jgi:hypothetical protein
VIRVEYARWGQPLGIDLSRYLHDNGLGDTGFLVQAGLIRSQAISRNGAELLRAPPDWVLAGGCGLSCG